MKKILLLSAALIITSACSKNTKQTLGLTELMPDEYQVTRNKSLEVPPCSQVTSIKKETNNSANTKEKFSTAEEALLKEME